MASYSDTILHNREEFDRVFREHHYKISTAGLYIMGYKTTLSFSRLGMVIPKKYMKRSVARNALKRRIRSYFRAHMQEYSVDCVVVSTAEMKNYTKDEFSPLVEQLFSKFTHKIDKGYNNNK